MALVEVPGHVEPTRGPGSLSRHVYQGESGTLPVVGYPDVVLGLPKGSPLQFKLNDRNGLGLEAPDGEEKV